MCSSDRGIAVEREDYMRAALALAKEAFDDGEVPVGAVVVRRGEIVGSGRNRREKAKNALCHAEIEAIDAACRRLGGWRLWECELYVTLEPCPMCAGAIVNARIPQIYFGAYDPKNGCCGSVADVLNLENGFHPAAEGGILEAECAALLSGFFKRLRE